MRTERIILDRVVDAVLDEEGTQSIGVGVFDRRFVDDYVQEGFGINRSRLGVLVDPLDDVFTLCFDAANYITGQVIGVDGGLSL